MRTRGRDCCLVLFYATILRGSVKRATGTALAKPKPGAGRVAGSLRLPPARRLPACRGRQLTGSYGGKEAVEVYLCEDIVIGNRSAHACQLFGRPSVEPLDPHHRPIATRPDGLLMVEPPHPHHHIALPARRLNHTGIRRSCP